MKILYLLFILLTLYHKFIWKVFAKNDYYTITIKRNETDEDYDHSTESIQNEIDDLVNDRMNDIYTIINNNKESYINDSGELDKKLEELEIASHLRKRYINSSEDTNSDINNNTDKNVKFKFINKNRPKKFIKRKDKIMNTDNDNEDDDNDSLIDMIPFESNLVIQVCPVSNYYVIIAYLSEDVVAQIEKLPNVESCKKKTYLVFDHAITEEKYQNHYYSQEDILEETHWKNVTIQEERQNPQFLFTHLSPLSQGYYNDSNTLYDNNYYYPSSAGKGIDIYVVDNGLNTSLNDETMDDFDTYEGTEDERVIQCEGKFFDGEFHTTPNKKQCEVETTSHPNANPNHHGTIVSRIAVGKINGAAKKANLHMIAVVPHNYNILAALDYIKQHARPHKTIVNLSLGCTRENTCKDQPLQDKILELVEENVIIFVSAGNESKDKCWTQVFEGAEGVLAIGSISNTSHEMNKMQNIYQYASYSNYGDCVIGFAPGTFRTPSIHRSFGNRGKSGTSYASPVVAGLAATLMSDDPNTEYNYESMKRKLIDLSLKNVIQGLPPNTPNRLINNGKKSIFTPPKCFDPLHGYHCGTDCCTQFGFCANSNITADLPYCLLENHCYSEFGFCTTKLCGKNNNSRKCKEGECCSREGICITISDDIKERDSEKYCYLENGCQPEFSDTCFTYDLEKIGNYTENQQQLMLLGQCQKEINHYLDYCDFSQKLEPDEIIDPKDHHSICDSHKSLNCDEFFRDPMKLLPTCQKIGYKHKFQRKFIPKFDISKQNIFCARKENHQDFCIENNAIFDLNYITNKTNVEIFCSDDGCYEPFLDFVRAYQKEFQSSSIKNKDITYFKKMNTAIKSILSFLTSTQCTANVNIKKITKNKSKISTSISKSLNKLSYTTDIISTSTQKSGSSYTNIEFAITTTTTTTTTTRLISNGSNSKPTINPSKNDHNSILIDNTKINESGMNDITTNNTSNSFQLSITFITIICNISILLLL